MDPTDVHPDLLGEALSRSGQRLAQLGSLLTSWAMVEARRIERRNAAMAAKSEQELRQLRAQERAAQELARSGWAPAGDPRWLASAGLVEVARAWSAAAAYADVDPGAVTALARCEDRLRQLHPYAMAWYDRQRAQGAGRFDAMQDALPLFARAPHARPGDRGAERPALPVAAQAHADDGVPQQWGQPWVADVTSAPGGGHDVGAAAERSAADLAAESFPWTAVDAVRGAASNPAQPVARPRAASPQPASRRRPAP
jgi:hypothetical protein